MRFTRADPLRPRPARTSLVAVALCATAAALPSACRSDTATERTRDASADAATLSSSAASAPAAEREDGSLATAGAQDMPGPLEAVAIEAADTARKSLGVWQTAPDGLSPDSTAYLELRRAAACGAPFWSRRAAMGSEVLLGPARSVDEAGGALLLLDAAIEGRDREAARREAAQIDQALRLIREEIRRNRVPLEVAAAALSTAAYDLGALALESSPGLPGGHVAVLADMRGTLDAIERGAGAFALAADAVAALNAQSDDEGSLTAVRAEAAALRAQLDAARTTLDLKDRGSIALASGRIGVLLRKLAESAGFRTRPPYPPRVSVHGDRGVNSGGGAGAGAGDRDTADPYAGDDEPVSALTLPAPRALRPGEAPLPEAAYALGRALFTDRRLSRGDVRSCATCHRPARAFADGIPSPRSLDPKIPRLRHTPSLMYTSLHAAQLWDGRTITAEDQALGVIHSRAEMGLTEGELVAKLAAVPELRNGFNEAFAGAPGEASLTARNVGRALGAFEVGALVPADAPIDRYARGDESALSPDEKAGLAVFVGRGRCARCHVPPFFGGSRPRDFAIPVFAVLGVPESPRARSLDPDRGRALVTGRALDERSFKTPTVRMSARTAPYFHNGRFRTLEEVVDFYNRGGGKGLGLDVANQDPDVRPLKLSPDEVRVLLIFLRSALLDATPPERLLAEPAPAPAPAPPPPG